MPPVTDVVLVGCIPTVPRVVLVNGCIVTVPPDLLGDGCIVTVPPDLLVDGCIATVPRVVVASCISATCRDMLLDRSSLRDVALEISGKLEAACDGGL